MSATSVCDKLDVELGLEGGTSHWLPAYGFQQPSQLQEHMALLQHERDMELFGTEDDEVMTAGGGGSVGQQSFLFLETIVEETSDDLRSESSCSGPAGWPDSDSDTASVIHVCNIGVTAVREWSGSERDLAVPPKRRRHNSDPGVQDHSDSEGEAEGPASSRSSSLLQFETLERHCEDVFRTTATNEPFACPGSPSALSYDSLEGGRWRYRRDSLASSSSDDTINRSFSSRSGNGSFRSQGVRSSRSYDSLILCQSLDKSESFLGGELSQSLNNTSLPSDCSEHVPTPRGMYKTVECLTEVAPHVACAKTTTPAPAPAKGSERSTENLSEDSGFGEHMSSCHLSRGQGVGTEGDDGWDAARDAGAKYNHVNWQSAPELARPQLASEPDLYTFAGSKSLVINYVHVPRGDDEVGAVPENKSLGQVSEGKMSRYSAVASTPDLYSATQEFLLNERRSNLKQRAGSAASLSRGKYDSASRLSTATGSSRGSNIQITTSFVNLSHSNSVKGVHFCPVVSEVSWQESSSEDEYEDDDVEDYQSTVDDCRESVSPPFEQIVEMLRASPVRRQPLAPFRHPEREDSVERRRVIEELHKLRLEQEGEAPPRRHVTAHRSQSQSLSVRSEPPDMEDARAKKKHGLGGFFQRFSFRRLSGRDKKKEKKKKTLVNSSTSTQQAPEKVRDRDEEDFKIIPLHPPVAVPPPVSAPAPQRPPLPSPVMAAATAPHPRGLLETDLDSDIAPASKKTRSLLNLDDGRNALKPCPVQREDSRESDSRARSMEFLLDKENQAAIQPPENELQKVGGGIGGGGERMMSEHQLRVQRSLQKLNVPEWYRNSTLPAQGFLLKRNSDAGLNNTGTGTGVTGGWQGLHNKTTSLSSLGSQSTQSHSHSAAPRSPNSHTLSPSPTSQVFSRWSTSRLSSGATSTSTSPCGSTRSSFNYRQPYLGWRSQERLSRPRTPAERLAADLLAKKQETVGTNPPNLNEVRSSIKEVTSAIVHYVSGTKDSTDRLSPALNPRWDRDTSSSRSVSPRGSTGRLCWLESSFVGSRPLDLPETPATTTTTGHDLYLDLNNHNHSPATQANGELVIH